MRPLDITVLGFKFFGGEANDCLFIEHPKDVRETILAIDQARKFLKDTGAHWVDLTMRSKDGKQELIKLYAKDYCPLNASKVLNVNAPIPTALELDPYSWANGK